MFRDESDRPRTLGDEIDRKDMSAKALLDRVLGMDLFKDGALGPEDAERVWDGRNSFEGVDMSAGWLQPWRASILFLSG